MGESTNDGNMYLIANEMEPSFSRRRGIRRGICEKIKYRVQRQAESLRRGKENMSPELRNKA